jgi:hypothetical protein
MEGHVRTFATRIRRLGRSDGEPRRIDLSRERGRSGGFRDGTIPARGGTCGSGGSPRKREPGPIQPWRTRPDLDLVATTAGGAVGPEQRKADRVAAAEEHVDEMKQAERLIIRLAQAGQVDLLGEMEAEYRRLEAES